MEYVLSGMRMDGRKLKVLIKMVEEMDYGLGGMRMDRKKKK